MGWKWSTVLAFFVHALVLAAAGCARDDAGTMAAQSLIEAERSFAALSADSGMRRAFLTYLAEDGVVFRPGPVNAQAWYRDRPEAPGVLLWEPAWVTLARSGDLGLSTGPWEYREAIDGAIQASGHFVSVWRRPDSGEWKVAADIGVTDVEARLIGRPPDTLPPGSKGWIARTLGHERAREAEDEIRLADEALEDIADEEGMAAALRVMIHPGARFYREGSGLLVGTEGLEAAARGVPARTRWETGGAGASDAGDVGYTYGLVREVGDPGADPDSLWGASYLRWWRRDEGRQWRLAADVLLPHPRP